MHHGVMTKRVNQHEPEVLLTPREAAEQLHVHPRTLQRMAERGDIAAVKLPSGHRRYRAVEIARITRSTAA